MNNFEYKTIVNGLLLVAADTSEDENVYKTPDELMLLFGNKCTSSKRDLALKMYDIGFGKTRVLFRNGKYSRYYVLKKEKLVELSKKMWRF